MQYFHHTLTLFIIFNLQDYFLYFNEFKLIFDLNSFPGVYPAYIAQELTKFLLLTEGK